jgi:hypothetical protein
MHIYSKKSVRHASESQPHCTRHFDRHDFHQQHSHWTLPTFQTRSLPPSQLWHFTWNYALPDLRRDKGVLSSITHVSIHDPAKAHFSTLLPDPHDTFDPYGSYFATLRTSITYSEEEGLDATGVCHYDGHVQLGQVGSPHPDCYDR